jgi:hypothetical protein
MVIELVITKPKKSKGKAPHRAESIRLAPPQLGTCVLPTQSFHHPTRELK